MNELIYYFLFFLSKQHCAAWLPTLLSTFGGEQLGYLQISNLLLINTINNMLHILGVIVWKFNLL